jgi:predicted O-linked N-acetylglucosamine transferase (SPINDLY family)
VSPDRIIFAERMQNIDEHLARISLADLFLDTFPYNAHTSAIDSLWAGVPIITKIGNTFASRLASSLLKSTGLDDLIVKDDMEYESLAVDLALHHEKLKIYRNKLEVNRKSHGLFNMRIYTKNLEKAITKMHEDFYAGLPADHITIE